MNWIKKLAWLIDWVLAVIVVSLILSVISVVIMLTTLSGCSSPAPTKPTAPTEKAILIQTHWDDRLREINRDPNMTTQQKEIEWQKYRKELTNEN